MEMFEGKVMFGRVGSSLPLMKVSLIKKVTRLVFPVPWSPQIQMRTALPSACYERQRLESDKYL
jgi:hypothetical protein